MKKLIYILAAVLIFTLISFGLFTQFYFQFSEHKDGKIQTTTIWATNDSTACVKAFEKVILSLYVSYKVNQDSRLTKIELTDWNGNNVFSETELVTVMQCANHVIDDRSALLGELPKDLQKKYGLLILQQINQ